MALKAVLAIVAAGLTDALSAVAASDTFADDGQQRQFYEVNNGSGSSINVTVKVKRDGPYKVPGVGLVTQADRVVAVGNGVRKKIGPFPRAFIDDSGLVEIQHSATTTVTGNMFSLAKEV